MFMLARATYLASLQSMWVNKVRTRRRIKRSVQAFKFEMCQTCRRPNGWQLALLFPCLAAVRLQPRLEKQKSTGPCPHRPIAYQEALLVHLFRQ